MEEDMASVFANGVSADTGKVLDDIDDSTGRRIADSAIKREEDISAGKKRTERAKTFGPVAGVNSEELSQAGWGVVFPAEFDSAPIEEALTPLFEQRRKEAGDLFKIFKGPQGWRAGESAEDWLARQGNAGRKGPGLDLVVPEAGVPYYLLIVGSPEALPMQFQYLLDIYWAVGRLHFATVAEYARYAKSVVDYEKASAPAQRKQAAIFATEHPFDAATQAFTSGVVRPFVDGLGSQKPLGQRQGFRLDTVLGDNATKDGLTRLLRGGRDGGPPALLFSGTHGMEFRSDDQRQLNCQGALVCQDWQGFGSVSENDWFSAADIPSDTRIHGMIHFLFACYGGGWEKFDTFRDGPDGQPRQIASKPAVSRLPQAMLTHPQGGALAVIAHVDRAWAYSFETLKGGSQNAGMWDVLTRIMMGQRVGSATDGFNIRWAALSAPIAEALRDFKNGDITGTELASQWIARDDARNYTIIGDPAVRLRVKDMADVT
jgi:hypothetical protein